MQCGMESRVGGSEGSCSRQGSVNPWRLRRNYLSDCRGGAPVLRNRPLLAKASDLTGADSTSGIARETGAILIMPRLALVNTTRQGRIDLRTWPPLRPGLPVLDERNRRVGAFQLRGDQKPLRDSHVATNHLYQSNYPIFGRRLTSQVPEELPHVGHH